MGLGCPPSWRWLVFLMATAVVPSFAGAAIGREPLPYRFLFHDRDVSIDIMALQRLLGGLGDGVNYMSANE